MCIVIYCVKQKEKSQIEDECTKLNIRIEELSGENSKLSEQLVRAQANDESARLIDTRQQLRQTSKQRDQLLTDKYVIYCYPNEHN